MLALGGCGDDGTTPALTLDGSVAGFLYLDADGNGAFEPFEGDELLPDVEIEVWTAEAGDAVQGGETGCVGGPAVLRPCSDQFASIRAASASIAAAKSSRGSGRGADLYPLFKTCTGAVRRGKDGGEVGSPGPGLQGLWHPLL